MNLRPWFYDFKRTISSKSIIILVAGILLMEILITYADFLPLQSDHVVNQLFPNIAFDMIGFGLLISLVVVFGGFVVFGSDKLRGVLDSILAQPVSRRGLVLSRFTSIFCAVGSASICSFLGIDLMFYLLTGSTFSTTFVLIFVFSYLSEIASVLALVFIITYFVKSPALLIGLVIGLWMFFGLLWSPMVDTIAALVGANAGNGLAFSAGFISANIDSYFVNPFLGFGSLAFVYTMQWFELNTPISPTLYGVSLFSLAITEALWVIAPLTFLMWIVARKD
jgi:ABC-type transport system involved in multi-copper enzyme maturation permease subunit